MRIPSNLHFYIFVLHSSRIQRQSIVKPFFPAYSISNKSLTFRRFQFYLRAAAQNLRGHHCIFKLPSALCKSQIMQAAIKKYAKRRELCRSFRSNRWWWCNFICIFHSLAQSRNTEARYISDTSWLSHCPHAAMQLQLGTHICYSKI